MTSFTIIHTHTHPLWITGQKISKLEGSLFKIWFSLPVSLTKSFIYIALCKRSWRTDCILNSPLALIGSYTKSLYRTSEKQVNTHVILGLTPILEQTWKLIFIGQKLYTVSYYWGQPKGLCSSRWGGHTYSFVCFHIPIWLLLCTSHFHSFCRQKKGKKDCSN